MTSASDQHAIRVLVVGNHILIRTALAVLLRGWKGIEVVGVSDPSADTPALAAQPPADIVVLQINSGNGVDACFQFLAALRENAGDTRVLVITDGKDADMRLRAVLLGAVGIVLEDQVVEVLERAIRKVNAGEAWLERTVTAEALSKLSRWQYSEAPSREVEPDPVGVRIESLTERERNVIALVCGGLQNREIGLRLSVSEATVRHHLTSIFEKLGLQNRLELVIFACRDYSVLLDAPPDQGIEARS